MNTISNPDTFRTNVRAKLCEILHIESIQRWRHPDDKTPLLEFLRATTANLERGVFNYAIKEATGKKIIKKWENPYFVQLYIDRLRTITINLRKSAQRLCENACEKLSNNLLYQIFHLEITPQQLAFMTHQEMDPSHWHTLIEQKIKRDANKFTTNIQASTDIFTCRKCKSKRCTYYELQTRSADEPATIFVTCLDCGKNWKN